MTSILMLGRGRGFRKEARALWLALSALLAALPCGFLAGASLRQRPQHDGVESGAAVDGSVRPRQAA